MVSIIKIEKENINRLNGRVLDLDGYYYKLFKDGELYLSFDFKKTIDHVIDDILEARELYIISYDTLSFMFMKMYGRRRYKIFLSNFLRALRVLECSTKVNVIFIRYSELVKNDPASIEDYTTNCY